jgi:NAD-dependent histone deacetylase SIR2
LFHASALSNPEQAPFFYKMMANMRDKSGAAEPTPTHRFIRSLDQQKQLLRLYSQNVDGLETKAGLSSTWPPQGSEGMNAAYPNLRAVMVHGVLDSVRCLLCSSKFPWTKDYHTEFDNGRAPDCPECCNRGT